MDEMNVFQIWDSIGRIVPFAVRRSNWDKQYYAVIEEVDCETMPYGKAYGFPVTNHKYSDHWEHDRHWKNNHLIRNAGSYQWTLVTDVDLSNDFGQPL